MLTVQSCGAQFNKRHQHFRHTNTPERHMVSRNNSDLYFTLRALKDKCHRKDPLVQISYRKYRAFACIWKCTVGYPTSTSVQRWPDHIANSGQMVGLAAITTQCLVRGSEPSLRTMKDVLHLSRQRSGSIWLLNESSEAFTCKPSNSLDFIETT